MAKGKNGFLARKLRVLKRRNKKICKNLLKMSVFTVIQLILNSYVLMVMMTGALLNNAHHNYVHNNEKNDEEMRNVFNCRRIASF